MLLVPQDLLRFGAKATNPSHTRLIVTKRTKATSLFAVVLSTARAYGKREILISGETAISGLVGI
jgi:hypothetical protein